ncbi:MAG: HD domain-containing protein [Patescibacteria group bacterium]|jgi:HD superfamily phosphodiesterase
MSDKINQIKNLVKNECKNLGFIDFWFYEVHLLGVEKFAKLLLKKLPKADKEIVMLGVWLHDLQRVRGIKGDHSKMGAVEAEKVMRNFQYSGGAIKQVQEIILTHQCDAKLIPKTLEGKILASADAMAHYHNDFYLTLAINGKRDLVDFKKWALEKLDRDYHKKIFFPFARKLIEKRHKVLQEVFTMK